MRKFFYLLAVPALALLAACSSPKTPEEVAEAYFEYLNDGEFEKLADLHYLGIHEGDPEERQDLIKDFKKRWERKTDEDELKKAEFIRFEKEDEIGKVAIVKLTLANGKEIEEEVTVVKTSKGDWKVFER